jgi:hypothetical protein
MSSNAQAHLARQFGLMSGLAFNEDYTKSPYFYRGYSTMPNSWHELKSITPDVKEVTYGATTEFRIPVQFDKLGQTTLAWTQAILTTTGGAYRRFCDWFPLALIEKIEIIADNTVVFTHAPEKKYLRVQKFVATEERDAEAACLFGNLSTAQRNTAATAVQDVIYDIPFQYTLAPDRYLEMRALADAPTLRITWRRLEQVVQTDGTVPVSAISNLRLLVNAIHFEAGERNVHVLLTEKDHGIVRFIEESVVVPRHSTCIIPASHFGGGGAPVSTHKVDLKNFKTDVRMISFWIRKKANYDPANLARNLWYESTELTNAGVPWIKNFRLISGAGEEITPWVTAKFNTLTEHIANFYGAALPGLYFISFAIHPMDELNASGSYNMNNIQDPQLELELNNFGSGGAGAEDLEVIIMRSQFNTIQTVRGQISRQFQL